MATFDPIPNPKDVVDIAPDVTIAKSSVEAMAKPIIPGFQSSGAGVSPVYALNSLSFVSNGAGWGLGSNGDAQFNGNHVVSTHFTPTIKLNGVTIYVSDNTSPNGTLSGATGDIVLNGDGGKLYVCVGGTSWYAPA